MLAFDIAFDRLRLKELRVTTVSSNQPVLSLNRKFGFRQTGIVPDAQIIGGKPVDLVQFLMTAGGMGEAARTAGAAGPAGGEADSGLETTQAKQ